MTDPLEPPGKGNSFLERIGGKQSQAPPEDVGPVREAFNSSRPHSEDDIMLDIRMSNGMRCALSYGTLLKVLYSPADQLTLAFAAETVVIEGRRLLPLYDLLRRHRAKFVQEGSTAEDGLKPEDAAHIDSIHFEDPEEDV